MLERYFTSRMTQRRLRFGPGGLYIDGFAAVREQDGYAEAVVPAARGRRLHTRTVLAAWMKEPLRVPD
jgi:hypothetical protein